MSKLEKIKAALSAMLEENIIKTPVEVKMGVVKTDKAVLEYDGDEDLVAGMPVYVTNEESGERTPATDGEYITEDNKTISVVDGKVESIVDPVAEVDGADDEVAPEGGEPKPEETPTEETPEENVETAEEVENPDGTEETAPDAVEELRKEVDELYKIVDSILEKIGETRREADERLTKIEKMSAAASAEQRLEEVTNTTPTKMGDAKIDAKLNRFREMNKNWKE